MEIFSVSYFYNYWIDWQKFDAHDYIFSVTL